MYFNNSQNNNISSVNSEYEETIELDDDQMTTEDYLEAFDFYEHFEERMEELKKSDKEAKKSTERTKKVLEKAKKSNERTKKVLAIARSVVSSGYENIDEAIEQIKEIQ